jgi:hypothetical protein
MLRIDLWECCNHEQNEGVSRQVNLLDVPIN